MSTFADNIEEIEVHGKRDFRQSINDVDVSQYNGFENIISRVEFENKFVSIPNLINELPSAQTLGTGGIGSYNSASIRGSTGKQVNIFVDGILLSSPNSGFSNLGIIPSSIVEAIEVYPDFTPVQLSDGNLAGAINIRTRAFYKQTGQDETFGGKVGTAYGSLNSKQSDISVWGGNVSNQIILAGSTSSSDNDYAVSKKLFPNLTSGNSHKRENSAFDQQDFFAKYKHHFNDVLSVNIMSNYSNANNEIPTIQNKTEAAAIFNTESLRNYVAFEADMNPVDLGIRLYTNDATNEFKDLEKSIALLSQHIESTEKTIGSTLYLEATLTKHQLSASMDASQTNIEKYNLLPPYEKIDFTRDKTTFALSDVWALTPNINLYGLARNYQVTDKTEKGTQNFRASCTNNITSCLNSNHDESSYQIGFSYSLNTQWLIKSNFGHMLRIPTLAEKFGEFGNYIGEPNLKPEKSTAFESGIIFDSQLLQAQVTYFSKDISDGIYVAFDARGVGHPSNISQATIEGIEFLSTLLITDELAWKFSGYTMDSENQSIIKANKGKFLHGIYHDGYFTSLTWCLEKHAFSTSYQVDDKHFYIPSNSVKADKKDSFNMSYTWSYSAWIINISADNLFNKQYSDFNRMPSMGRFFSTSVHYQF